MADSIKIRITGDDSQYSQVLEGLGGKAQKAFGGVSSVMKGMLASQIVTKGFSMLTGSVRDAISAGMDFGAAMSQVAAVSGAEGDELKALTAKAKEMGAETQFSASQAAEAMNYMAMAGWKTEEMLGGIEGIMNLAAAAGEDLGTTSDIVTDALTAFGMQASDAGHFADILAAASSNANTNVSMMGETFKYVAPLAGALGYTAEDMAAAIGLMANSGIKGSQAGTALRGTLTRLSKPTKESAEAMEALDLSITDSSGKMKPFMQIMEEMRDRFAGLSESEKAQYAAMIAGQEGMSGLLAIVNASEADFEKLTGAIDGCDGAAEKMAKVQMDNLAGDVKLVQSAFEGLQLAISESTNGMARDLVQGVNDMLTAMNQAYAQGGMDGMIDAFGKEFPKLLTKVISVLEKLVAEVVRKLPDLLRQLAAALPGILETLLSDLPGIAESLFAAVSAVAEQLISDLPRLVPMLVQGVLNLAGAVIKGVAQSSLGLTGALVKALTGQSDPDFESLGSLDGKLTYDISTEADVDNSGAKTDVDTKWQEFVDSLKTDYGLTTEQIAQILAFKGTEEELDAWLEANFPDLDAAAREAIKANYSLTTENSSLADLFQDSELSSFGLTAADIGQLIVLSSLGADIDAWLLANFPDLDESARNVIKAKLTKGGEGGVSSLFSDEELTGLGLSGEDIGGLILAGMTGADIDAYLDANFPDLSASAKKVIKDKLSNEETGLSSIYTELTDIGLDEEDIGGLILASLTAGGIETYLDTNFPDMPAVVKSVIKSKLTGEETGLSTIYTDLTDMGLTATDIGNLLIQNASGADIDAYLQANFPDLTTAARTAIKTALGEGETAIGATLAAEMTGYGLTGADIGGILMAQASGADIDAYLEANFPDLTAAARTAIKNALGEGESSIGSTLVSELKGLGISDADIVTIITAKAEGDDSTIETLLESKYSDVKQDAINALKNAWSNSTASFDTSDTSVGFVTGLIVDMFTNGVKEDDASVEAALEIAKEVIKKQKQKLIDYINSGQDTDGKAAEALGQLNELEAALTDYAANYATATTAECAAQGKALMQMAQQCQDTVDSIALQSERLISMQENMFNLGSSGTKLTSEDAVTALNWIQYQINDRKKTAEEARDLAKQNAKTAEEYDAAETAFLEEMGAIRANARSMLADLVSGQLGTDSKKLMDAFNLAKLFEQRGMAVTGDLEGVDVDALNKQIAQLYKEIFDVEVDPENLENAALNFEGYWRTMTESLDDEDADLLASMITTMIDQGIFEGIEGVENMDLNNLLYTLFTNSDPVEVDTPTTITTEPTVDESVPDKITEAIEEETTAEPVDVQPTVNVTDIEASEESPIEDTVVEKLRSEGIDVDVAANVSLTVAVSDSNAAEVGKIVGEALGGAIASGVDAKADDVKTATTTVIGSAATAAKSTSAYQSMQSAGKFVMSGFKAGLAAKADEIYTLCQQIADKVAETVSSALKVESPSKVFMRIGRYTGEGFEIGLRDSMQNAVKTARDVVSNMNLNTRVLPDFEGAISGAVTSVYAAENSRPIYLNVNGKNLARVISKDTQQATNNANRRVGLGVGK